MEPSVPLSTPLEKGHLSRLQPGRVITENLVVGMGGVQRTTWEGRVR